MIYWALLPMVSFLVLVVLEKLWPAHSQNNVHSLYTTGDWVLNLCGFFMQGAVVPLAGYAVSTHILPHLLGTGHCCLTVGFAGAFILNMVVVDLLYYFQHRAFHEIPCLWKLHATHHYSPTLNVWATSRNALVTNFLFVYLLINPLLGYLCDVPEGFFAGAMVTASLDLLRHANTRLPLSPLQGVLISPLDHHRHHDADKPGANYGANFIVWDRIFGTYDRAETFPQSYKLPEPPPFHTQLFFPWRT